MKDKDKRAERLHESCLKSCFPPDMPPDIRDSMRKCLAPTLTHLENLDDYAEFRRQIGVEAYMFDAMSPLTSDAEKSNYLRVRGRRVQDALSNAVYRMEMLECTAKCANRSFVPGWIRKAMAEICKSELLSPLASYYYLLSAVHMFVRRDLEQSIAYAMEGIRRLEPLSGSDCACELYRMLALAHLQAGRPRACGESLSRALEIAKSAEHYIPSMRALLYRTLIRYNQAIGQEQEVAAWEHELELLAEKHPLKDLSNCGDKVGIPSPGRMNPDQQGGRPGCN